MLACTSAGVLTPTCPEEGVRLRAELEGSVRRRRRQVAPVPASDPSQLTSGEMADLDGSDASSPDSQASYSQYRSEDGTVSSATRRSSSGSGQTYTPTPIPTPTPSHTTIGNSPSNNAAAKMDSLLFNKIDERQKLARERREEREKQNAVKEVEWQAREERARQHYEKHLEERRRRLEEQRVKEDKRRAAVDEKRRQKLEEDRVRHEAVMRRTLERSQRTRPKPIRWSWGGALSTNTPSTPAGFVESAFLYPLDLAGLEHMQSAFSLYHRYGMTSQYGDRRSVSTMNLSKHADPVITKRLSYSSATLLHSPDRGLQMRTASSPVINKAHSKLRLHQGKTNPHRDTGLRRLPLTPWESNVVNRLQQPTHSYLARSRSAMSLSGDQAVSCQPMGSMSFKALQAQPLPHCRSQERSLSRETASSSSTTPRRRTTGTTQQRKHCDHVRKSWSNLSLPLVPIVIVPPSKRSSSTGKKISKTTAPSPGRPPQKTPGRPPTPKLLKSPGAEDPGNLRPFRISHERPHSPTPKRAQPQEEEQEQVLSPPQPRPQPLGQNRTSNEQTPTAPTVSSESITSPPGQRLSAGTTDPEEASRILAENRRLAREQRERDEEQRKLQEEQARLAKEEMARRKAEERVKESQRQAEERRMKEEEEKKADEERLEKEREDAEKLQIQKEEEESRQREEAERVRQEREKHFQKEEAERLERKKRLEEIMKRTRRSDAPEKKVIPSRNGDSAASPAPSAVMTTSTHNSNGQQTEPNPSPSTEALSHPDHRENGDFEEVIVLPSHSRLSPPEGEEQQQQLEERVPVIAFRENGLLKPLSGIEEISAQQGPDVA
ncbi:ensconsin isoform X4 [Hippoglossus hippoglossus]|uniref:ensconsin isoform X4 n=1 Tax=Hippoglossus hippoglossus TaxID=8267 RepID=UPI00148E7B69|nr:ensconsin isoform X4 [Hippoglossus hippoglossus]